MKLGEILDEEQVIPLSFGTCAVMTQYKELVLFKVRPKQKEQDLFGANEYLIGGRKSQGVLYYLVDQSNEFMDAHTKFKRLIKNSYKMEARAHV